LLPSNPEYSIRVVPASQVEILGKLVGIIRKL
jgi:SOS-response transcriptional repressor LexA